MRDGEEFDTESGRPTSMEEKKSAVSWYVLALRYLAMKWPHAAPNTRNGINESDPTEVAEHAGNSVEVLLTRYAKCLDGRQDVANRRIEDLLREYE
ncbi:hypothetical protein AB0N23_12345 [Streptomyces sp. NPDC052644]